MKRTFLTLMVTASFFITFTATSAAPVKSEKFDFHVQRKKEQVETFCRKAFDPNGDAYQLQGDRERCVQRILKDIELGILSWCKGEPDKSQPRCLRWEAIVDPPG